MSARSTLISALAFTLAASCGGGEVTVTVTLSPPSIAGLDPYATGELALVRVTIDGPERLDDAAVDVALDGRTATFQAFPGDRAVTVSARGFDAQGTLLAFGRADGIQLDEDTAISVPFRRTLAYVTHRTICNGNCGEGASCVNPGDAFACHEDSTACGDCGADRCVELRSVPTCLPGYSGTSAGPGQLYVLDMVSRALVDRVAIPGTTPRGRGVSARGGQEMIVTYTDGGAGFVGRLTTDDHAWTSIALSHPADLAVVGSTSLGVAGGGGFLSVFDVETGEVESETPIGGRLLDAAVGLGGTKAILVFSASPRVVLVDLTDAAAPLNPGEVAGAAGVAISDDGAFAFVTSETDRSVSTVDMDSGSIARLPGAFTGAISNAVYSERMRSVIAVQNQPADNIARVLAYSIVGRNAREASVRALPLPTGIAAGPDGRRMLVVSAGTSTRTAGMTTVDGDLEFGPDGSSVLYPADPDDVFINASGFEERQRYHPNKVAAIYGR